MQDLINRDAAIEALAKAGIENYAAAGNDNGMLKAVNVIKAIPAAQPTQTNAEPNAESTKDFDKDTNVPSTDTISRQDAIDEIMKCRYVVDAIEKIKALPSAQPEQTDCEYCHEDIEGYVKPIEKNGHAFVCFGMDGWELNLQAKGWHGSAKIMYCPMCGRRLERG